MHIFFVISLQYLVDLKGWSTTWGMQTTPPKAAVRNFGQCTKVW